MYEPVCAKVVLQMATPLLTGSPLHPLMGVVPIAKFTVPPGVPLPGELIVTAARIATGCVICAGLDAISTVTAAFDTVCVTNSDDDAANVESPRKFARIVWLPGRNFRTIVKVREAPRIDAVV